MAFGEIPRGLADLQVAPLVGGAPGTWVDVPGARTLSFNVEADSDELEGDNQIIAKVRNPASISGNIEVGRINLASQAVMLGGTVETDGTEGSQVTSLSQSGGVDIVYFTACGQAPSVDQEGSAYRVTLPQLLASSGPSESMEVNAWNTPTIDFEGLEVDGELILRQQFETMVELPPA